MAHAPTLSATETVTITFEDVHEAQRLLGREHELVRLIQAPGDVQVVARGAELRLTGAAPVVDALRRAVEALLTVVREGGVVGPDEMRYVLEQARTGAPPDPGMLLYDEVPVAPSKPPVRTKTRGQQRYMRAMAEHDITFSIGPAGTGKTYLAVAMAVHAYLAKQVERLVLCRPAVEAGEELGFLPGDLQQKVFPYLRPLYDALHDMMSCEAATRLQATGQIEVAPLAYMRGRTLNNCFVILDEAQNTTSEQMRMFLTRLGRRSRAVITGDVTQIDLADPRRSGLVEAETLLRTIPGLGFVHLDRSDVVRHRLVQEIINAYEQRDAARSPDGGAGA